MTKTIIFSHGKDGSPHGRKAVLFAELAADLNAHLAIPDYRSTSSMEHRIDMLVSLIPQQGQTILVGSSLGGYLSIMASHRVCVDGIVLLAPALGLPGYNPGKPDIKCPNSLIIHGWKDTVIPAERVFEYAKRRDGLQLTLVDDDHRLHESFHIIRATFILFMQRIDR